MCLMAELHSERGNLVFQGIARLLEPKHRYESIKTRRHASVLGQALLLCITSMFGWKEEDGRLHLPKGSIFSLLVCCSRAPLF